MSKNSSQWLQLYRFLMLVAALAVLCMSPTQASAQAQLSLSMSAPSSVNLTYAVTYSLVITNTGSAAVALSDGSLEDTLPLGTAISSADGSVCYSVVPQQVECVDDPFDGLIVNLSPGEQRTISITVSTNASGNCAPLVNAATLSFSEAGVDFAPLTATATTILNGCGNSYTVTPSAGVGGSISPNVPVSVVADSTATFTLTANSGYTATAAGTCGGSLSGNSYTTSPIGADCTVEATFLPNIYTVTPSASPHGTISPSTPVAVSLASTPTFTITPDPGFGVLIAGTCDITSSALLTGSPILYPVDHIAGSCSLVANFVPILVVTVEPANALESQPIALIASVPTGSPPGTVTFNAFSFLSGVFTPCTNVPLVSNEAVCNIPPHSLPDNSYAIYVGADFGDLGNSGNTSTPVLTISSGASTTTLQGPNPTEPGAAMQVAASVVTSPAGAIAPTGTVTIADGTDSLSCSYSLSQTPAGCAITPASAGVKSLTASYSGDSNYPGSTSAPLDVSVDAGYVPLDPARIMDLRAGQTTIDGLYAGTGPLIGGVYSVLTVAGRGGVPSSGVTAVALNVTATNPTAPGYVTLWPEGSPQPLASNLNFTPGETIPNLVIAKVGEDGQIALLNSAGSVDLIADVVGYFTKFSALNSLAPLRILDTRPGFSTSDGRFAGSGPLIGGQTLKLTVAGRGSLPTTGIGAVVMNLTATSPTVSGFITAWPSDQARPLASNLNFVAGETIPNLVISAVSTSGQVSLYNSGGATNLIADVMGWFPTRSELTPTVPARLLDTRTGMTTIDGKFAGIGAVPGAGTLDLTVAGRGAVPASGVSAVVLNVTAVSPTASGFATVWPAGSARPLASNLNFTPGQIIPNLVIVEVGQSGQISLFNSAGSTDFVADVVGWFPTSP